jgi:hypothetical protein
MDTAICRNQAPCMCALRILTTCARTPRLAPATRSARHRSRTHLHFLHLLVQTANVGVGFRGGLVNLHDAHHGVRVVAEQAHHCAGLAVQQHLGTAVGDGGHATRSHLDGETPAAAMSGGARGGAWGVRRGTGHMQKHDGSRQFAVAKHHGLRPPWAPQHVDDADAEGRSAAQHCAARTPAPGDQSPQRT